MHPRVFIIFSLVILQHLHTTTTNQLVGGSNGVVINKKMCIDEERHALLDFKARVQDPNGFLSTWTTNQEEDDCCNWEGVTCNDTTSHVTQLDVTFGLHGGEFSPSLANLTYLNYLDLSGNSLNGTIPRSIGQLTKLRKLDLRSNNFIGAIPRSIGYLTELTNLHLAFNSFSGIIPSEIGNLTQLEQLSLRCLERSSCVIENIDWLANLSHLQELNMEGVYISKANHWVDVFQCLKKLTVLRLSRCDLSQVMYPAYYLPSSFLNSSSSSSSSNITRLDISNNNLNSSMYHWLFPLTSNSLYMLDLSGNMLDGIPKYFGNLCRLKYFVFTNNSASIKFADILRNLSGCTSDSLIWVVAPSSHLKGPISDVIQRYSSLEFLNLSDNQLEGALNEKLWELPMLVGFDVSSNFLSGAISENIGKSKILGLDLSNNSLQGVVSANHFLNNSFVINMYLRSCKLGPRFPSWIKKLKNLTSLDLSNNGISDTIPLEFWSMWPSRLKFLDLSSNNITAQIPDLLSNFDNLPMIDLSSNNLYGPIPNVSSTLTVLNLSGNKFSGGISFICQIVGGYLRVLDLSNNLLSGQVPDCLGNFSELKVLNLGHNNLFGRLPGSVESLYNLEVLNLYKNEFSGELPSSLKNCTSLQYLNLGANNFSGNVPLWIGESLSELYVLSLSLNNFLETIPLQLCQLVNLQLLDLSQNNLSGTIPSCINNLTTMVEGFVPTKVMHDFPTHWTIPKAVGGLFYKMDQYYDHAIIKWQGNVREFSKINLGLLRIIDLSSNNLKGQFPYELTNLHGLIALNLSKNALHGEIPWNISEMRKLLTLDISENNFSGGIPPSMVQMTLLNDLDVSYNSLSGRIPSSTQLQSFEPSRYNGNAGLCGPPVTKICAGDEESPTNTVVESGEDIDDELQIWFYIGGGIGFVTGFWIVCGTLVLNNRFRHAFFHYLDLLKDWIYVKVMVFLAKLQRDVIRLSTNR